MNKVKHQNFWINIQNIVIFFIFTGFTIITWILLTSKIYKKSYLLLIEFNNAHGLKEGTSLTMRGVNIGYIKNLKIDLNSILVLVNIKSSHILIPKNSIIETNQTGLLNDAIINIIPLEHIKIKDTQSVNVFSSQCITSPFLCHLNYVEGDRGLNYDDLVRAATRLSQRFDDPAFFNVFYLFLQNSIDLSDNIVNMTFDLSDLITIFYSVFFRFIQNYR
ncbi:conserved hypothetical plastid protein (plastid) [Chondrus crispus]|uniref:Conserved hypothetical plastid protein n=1 Tax=Chondrus crispus TaxID=2769 RepID=M5DDI3_CHOCR|nr:conserved hypothetical plastid protein [Chondrus crispus]CCP38218.1 conserved hypothetical plastid protein [Chondrus crispus]|eukprot:YP_007627471.1 conserved hypothetical plastid protein (plastid) [Chondrus crispus]